MSDRIQRYEIDGFASGFDFLERDYGSKNAEWCDSEDVDKLESENKQLKAERDRWIEATSRAIKINEQLKAELVDANEDYQKAALIDQNELSQLKAERDALRNCANCGCFNTLPIDVEPFEEVCGLTRKIVDYDEVCDRWQPQEQGDER